MTFPIHPNNYNSMLPAPHQCDEANVFSEGIRRVRLLRAAQLECATLILVWIDVAMVTHQIVLDFALSGLNGTDSTNQNNSSWLLSQSVAAAFRNDHPALNSQASMALFIAITVMAFLFLLETVARNIYSRVSLKRYCILNVCDAILCSVSFCTNLALLISRVTPLARDFVALLIAFRLIRIVNLFGGLTRNEKRQILRMLEGYRREESFNSEHQRMLQSELENRTRECQDLRELVKSATLSRNRLKQKQQLQIEKQQQQQKTQSITDSNDNQESSTDYINGYLTAGSSGHNGSSPPDDSGHSSDSSPDSPQDAFIGGLHVAAPDSPVIDIELAEVGAFGASEAAAATAPGGRQQNDNIVSSRM